MERMFFQIMLVPGTYWGLLKDWAGFRYDSHSKLLYLGFIRLWFRRRMDKADKEREAAADVKLQQIETIEQAVQSGIDKAFKSLRLLTDELVAKAKLSTKTNKEYNAFMQGAAFIFYKVCEQDHAKVAVYKRATLDEAIQHCNDIRPFLKPAEQEDHAQLQAWLEELRDYRQSKAAIDECVHVDKPIEVHCFCDDGIDYPDCPHNTYVSNDLNKVADCIRGLLLNRLSGFSKIIVCDDNFEHKSDNPHGCNPYNLDK